MTGRSIHGFSVGEKLGAGVFGEVYKASKDGVTYAMKRIPIATEQQAINEVNSLSRLSSDNVIKFYARFREAGFSWIVLEYCDGGDLNKYIQYVNPGITPDQLLGFMKQLASCIEYLHSQDVIHRDIKPDNIMLCYGWFRWPVMIIKVADFGLSRTGESFSYQSPYYNVSGSCIGPPYYTAPEVFQGHATKKSDIYGLGCLVMAMFSRTTVQWFDGKPLLAPYICRNGRKQISEATDGEKLSFIREYVKLPFGDQVKLQNLVYSMVDENWRNRPNAKEAVRRANDIGPGFCNIL